MVEEIRLYSHVSNGGISITNKHEEISLLRAIGRQIEDLGGKSYNVNELRLARQRQHHYIYELENEGVVDIVVDYPTVKGVSMRDIIPLSISAYFLGFSKDDMGESMLEEKLRKRLISACS